MGFLRNVIATEEDVAPFSGHAVSGLEEYQRELYLVFMAALVRNFGQSDNRMKFLRRLASGLGFDEFDRYIKKALNIDDAFLDELLKNFSGNDLTETLLVDMMLVAGLDGEPEESVTSLASRVFDMFMPGKETVAAVMDKARYILENDDGGECCGYPVSVIHGSMDIDHEITYDSDVMFLNCELNFRESGKLVINGNARFEKCTFYAPDMLFSGCEKVRLKDCRIREKSEEAVRLVFAECGHVIIKGMEWQVTEDFTHDEKLGIIQFDSTKKVEMLKSRFEAKNNKYPLLSIYNSDEFRLDHNSFGKFSGNNDMKFITVSGFRQGQVKGNSFEAISDFHTVLAIESGVELAVLNNSFSGITVPDSFSRSIVNCTGINSLKMHKNGFRECNSRRHNYAYGSINIDINSFEMIDNSFVRCKNFDHPAKFRNIRSGTVRNIFEECNFSHSDYDKSICGNVSFEDGK